jgi:carbamoyltransferase
MRILGISALTHDAAVCLIEHSRILFAAHSERYSRVKNDHRLNQEIIDEALRYGMPDLIAWNGRPFAKKARHALAGRWQDAVAVHDLPRFYLRQFDFGGPLPPVKCVDHHESHAAAGFFTSGFPDTTVITADAIGDFDTFTIAEYRGGKFRFVQRTQYPDSLGLLYSAFTRRCGLQPNKEEYILMAMSAMGEPRYVQEIEDDFIRIDGHAFELACNVHRGIGNWMPDARNEDLAASIQAVIEMIMTRAAQWARQNLSSRNLVLMGGVALNCVANARIARESGFERVWIMPNPGDAGSSLGAAAAIAGRQLDWDGPYLGSDIDRDFPAQKALDALLAGHVIGVATGRAEFGPRALGNRSILADPRSPRTKAWVNDIKRRQQFRPFAPVVLEQFAADLFELVVPTSPYMQYTMKCRVAEQFPAIVHHDGSSRVQTVNERQNAKLYALLRQFHEATGCPLLLNTSLNVRNEPLVNSWQDALRFSEQTGIPVF